MAERPRLDLGQRRGAASVRMRLAGTPEGVPYARATITRLCNFLEFESEFTDRVRLALTEACELRPPCLRWEGVATYDLDARVEDGASA